MRREFNAIMDGLFPEIPKAQNVVLRKMRRVGNQQFGDLVKCLCVDDLTKEPDLDTFCPICHGEGFLWDETFIDSYKVVLRSDVGKSTKETLISPGNMNIPIVSFYARSNLIITLSDKIVELYVNEEGEPIRPYRREALYRIGTPVDLRSDYGRLEYWKIDGYKEQRKFLNGPKASNG